MKLNNQQIITEFYSAFKKLDAETMISFYSDEIQFEDPAFGKLEGERAANMWRMLINSQKGKEFSVEFGEVTAESALWEAKYTFSQTGKKVHNVISAKFEIKDGKIVKHTDSFNLHKWARQALGWKGWLLGGTNFFQKKLQLQTNRLLDKYEANQH